MKFTRLVFVIATIMAIFGIATASKRRRLKKKNEIPIIQNIDELETQIVDTKGEKTN